MTGQFEIFQDGTRFWFRLLGEEREVLAVSGGFAEKAQAAKAIMAVRENAAAGHIVDKSSNAASAEPAPKGYSPPPAGPPGSRHGRQAGRSCAATARVRPCDQS